MNISRRDFLVTAAGLTSLALSGCGDTEVGSEEPSVSTESAEAEPEPLKVSKSGYCIDDYGSAYIGAVITNPNKTWAAQYISITASAKSVDGNVLATQSSYMSLFFADGDAYFADLMAVPAETASIELQANVSSDNWSQMEDINQSDYNSQFPITGASEQAGYGGIYVAGEVTNNHQNDWSNTRINAIFLDGSGSIVGGSFCYLTGDFISGSTLPFQTMTAPIPEHASFELFVDCGYVA